MSKDEFCRRVHEFEGTKEEAEKEVEVLNQEGIDGDEAVVINFGGVYGIVLKSNQDFINGML